MNSLHVIGQQALLQRLEALHSENRLPHALLFCGPRGAGKLAVATAFAAHLLGDSPMIRKWEHPDLHFTYPIIRPTGTPSDRKIICDDFIATWRELLGHSPYFNMAQWLEAMGAANQQAIINVAEADELSRKLNLKASQGGYKISIIWLPERMNAECANKLLKLLEEPPAQTLFMLVSEAPEQLLETIRSRTQRIDVKPVETTEIEHALIEKRGIEPATAHRLARIAAGSWHRALEELDSNNERRLHFQLFQQLMRSAYQRNLKALKAWSEEVAALGREKQRSMLTYFMRLLRENFMYNFGMPQLNYMTEEEEAFAKNFARFINEANVVELVEQFEQTSKEIGQNANAKIVFFDMALQIIILLIKK